MEYKHVTRLDYCQFLLSSQINYTLTYFADHVKKWSHDVINRYLKGEHITPRLVWENVRADVVTSPNGYVVFDDTVLEKPYSSQIGLVRRQYSGNAKTIVKGIGVVNCVYVNPDLDRFWIIDYRIYQPDDDGKTKLRHACEMLSQVRYQKVLPFQGVLMDTWYAKKWFLLVVERMQKVYYCPIQANRLVNESGAPKDYHHVSNLAWTADELQAGKRVHLRGFPQGHQVKVFRLQRVTTRTEPEVDYVVTNARTSVSLEVVQQANDFRWNVEEFHRETKQLTGIEACQCRSARIQRNHIGCAILVWIRLKHVAYTLGHTIYQLKRGLLDEYLTQQLKNPTIKMVLA